MNQKTTTSLTLKKVQLEMVKCLGHFSNSSHTPESLLEISGDYHEAFIDERVTPVQFEFAAKMVKRECSFYPTIKDFLDQVKTYRLRPKESDYLAIDAGPQEMSEEQAAAGLKKVQAIIAMASGKMSMDDALEVVTPVKEFGGQSNE